MNASQPVDENGLHPPSGPWRGFYTYWVLPMRGYMDLALAFTHGILRGSGIDPVGPFIILGRYDPAAGECHWTKTYPGRHSVFYKGYYEGRGIWGTWEIVHQWHGGFHIWPVGLGEGATASAEEAAPVQADAAGVECPVVGPPRPM